MTDKRLAIVFFQLTIKEKAAKNKPANSFVVLFFFFSNCLHACLGLALCHMHVFEYVCVIFVRARLVDGLPPWLVPEGCQLRRIGD